jgi:hypothetical protein
MVFAQFIGQWQVGRVSIFSDDFGNYFSGNYFSCDSYALMKDGLDECFRRDAPATAGRDACAPFFSDKFSDPAKNLNSENEIKRNQAELRFCPLLLNHLLGGEARTMTTVTRTVLLLMLCLLAGGCWEGDARYFKRINAYREPRNALREQRSIPIIPSDWVVRADRSAVAWDNPDFRNGKETPMHQYKFLTFANIDSGEILEETDRYESGRRWVDPDAGTMHEYLDITYSFELERQAKPPWKAEVRENGSSPRQITLAEAEEILARWGIDRLKFNKQNQETAQQSGAANGSQPIRSETNRTSSAAGSPR